MSKLFYIIGASGAGKDSLINHCRSQINGLLPVVFAHRYITRPANAGGENHVWLTEQEFLLRLQKGLFALHWESHGLYYGIGIEIEQWLRSGLAVIVNGSRGYLNAALQKYPDLQAILIAADAETIKDRLQNRGREDSKGIDERITRNQHFNMADSGIISIQNNGTIEEAATSLLTLIIPAEKAALQH